MSMKNEILEQRDAMDQDNIKDMNEVYLIDGDTSDVTDIYIDLDDSDDALLNDAEVNLIEGADDAEETLYINLDDSADEDGDIDDVYLIPSEVEVEDGDVLLIDAQDPDNIQEYVAVTLSSEEYVELETFDSETENVDNYIDADESDDEDFIAEDDDYAGDGVDDIYVC